MNINGYNIVVPRRFDKNPRKNKLELESLLLSFQVKNKQHSNNGASLSFLHYNKVNNINEHIYVQDSEGG